MASHTIAALSFRRLTQVSALLGLVLLVLLAVGEGFVREYSGDFHWHVVMGEQTLHTGHIAKTDAFSHTFAGRPLHNTAWLGDVLLALGFRAGYPGVYVLRALALVAVALLLRREARRSGVGPGVASLLAALPLLHAPLQRYVRPEMFAFASLALLLHFLGEHGRRGGRGPLVGALVTVVLWANLHGSVCLGVFAVGCYALEQGVRRLAARDWRGTALWAALPFAALGVACLSPQGLGGALGFQIMQPSWLLVTPEWMPLPGWPPLVAIAALVAVGSCVLAGRRVSWWRLLFALTLALFAARYRRFLVPALIAGVPLVAANLPVVGERLARLSAATLRRLRVAGGIFVATVVALAASTVLGEARLVREVGLGSDPGAYPERACAWAKTQKLPGELFNSGTNGSFLMWCLPEHKVFNDQRAWSLYDEAFFSTYLKATLDPELLEKLVAQYDVGWAFTGYDVVAATLSRRPDLWRLVYFDDEAQIYVRLDRLDAAARAETGLVALHPGLLGSLPGVRGERLARAQRELAVQRTRCADCQRTLLATAGVAVAAGDDAAFEAAFEPLLARGESPELAYLAARRAESKSAWVTAAELYARARALGGDALATRLFEAQSRHRGGDRVGAQRLLAEAERLPGGASAAASLRAQLSAPTP